MPFCPMATSTPFQLAYYNTPSRQNMIGNENHLTNGLSNISNSTVNQQQQVIVMSANIPMTNLQAQVASNDIISLLETTNKEKTITKTTNKTVQSGNSTKNNDERINRMNFFFKNISTPMTYMDAFISIATQYPLIQINTIGSSPKIQYICAAGNVLLI